MTIIKIGISGLTASELVSKAAELETKMDGNASFPTPTPTLVELADQRAVLREWITKAANGDREAIANRNAAYKTLADLMRQLAAYVTNVANGSETVILSSGFEVRRRPEPTPGLSRPVDVQADRTAKKGQVLVDWKPVRGSKTYVVEMTTDEPSSETAVWTILGYPSRSRYVVDNLQIGTFYYFRVRAIGVRDMSASSDVALVMAA